MQRLAARAAQTEVAESLHLIRVPASAGEDDVSQLVDGIWSLQYLAAGPICGSAGPLSHFRCGGGEAGPPYTHAVLFRYSNAAARERFEGQPRVQLMLGGTGAPPGTAISTLNFQGRVPSELESIFRRGPEWGAGVELVAALALQARRARAGGGSEADAEEFLSLTQQLAVSSAYGAVQCSYGRCDSAQHSARGAAADAGAAGASGSGSGSDMQPAAGGDTEQQAWQRQPDLVLLARFQEAAQLQQFLACPPVAALLEGDARIPLACLWSCVLEAEPSDSSTTRGVQGGLM